MAEVDLAEKLSERLRQAAPDLERLNRYYEGEQPLSYMHPELLKELHAMLRGSFSKGDFAATLFERLNAGQDLKCPAYITDALTWLSGQLNVTAGETP